MEGETDGKDTNGLSLTQEKQGLSLRFAEDI